MCVNKINLFIYFITSYDVSLMYVRGVSGDSGCISETGHKATKKASGANFERYISTIGP